MTMPERVWLDTESRSSVDGSEPSYFCYENEPPWECVPYVPESRALRAEAGRDAAGTIILALGEKVMALEARLAEATKMLQAIAGSSAQKALCEGPTRRLEHLTTMCPHCRARAYLEGM